MRERMHKRTVAASLIVGLSAIFEQGLTVRGDENPPIPAKLLRYGAWLIQRQDANKDGVWTREEWGNEAVARLDRDGNSEVSAEEVAAHAWEYALKRGANGAETSNKETAKKEEGEGSAGGQQGVARGGAQFYVKPGRLPEGLPAWFVSKDTDGDGQLSVAEFAPGGGGAEVNEFRRLDLNEDGILTARECVAKPRKSTSGEEKPRTVEKPGAPEKPASE